MRLLALCVVAIVALSGCAHPIVITADSSRIVRDPGSKQKVATQVGYYIPDSEIRTEVTTPGGGGDSVRYYPYRDLEPGYRQMLGNVFESVTKVSAGAESKAMAGAGIKYVISPKVFTNSSSSSMMTWPPTQFSVDLTCDVRDVEGNLLASPRVVGVGQYSTVFSLTADHGTAGKRAMLDALLQMQRTLLDMRLTKSPPKQSGGNSPVAQEEHTPKGNGSGAIITAEGHVLTAAHVVAEATSVKVLTSQGIMDAEVLKVDDANDIAVIKIREGQYTPLPIAPSRAVRLGQSVATMGFPNVMMQGFSPKVTKGEISSLNGITDDPRAWQISVPVQPGNSGGPLIDENGNLVGVVVAVLNWRATINRSGSLPQNVSYAVKSAYALPLLDEYLSEASPKPNYHTTGQKFEDVIAKVQESVVLVLVY